MSQSNIETKTELAAVRHLNGISSSIGGITIRAGVTPGQFETPHVVCSCSSAREHIFGSGQQVCELHVVLTDNANDTTAATHQSRVAAIREQFFNDWSAVSLSSHVSDYTVAGVVPQESTQNNDEMNWSTDMEFSIHCRPSD